MCCAEVVRRVTADRRREDDDMLPPLILNLYWKAGDNDCARLPIVVIT